MADSSFNLHSLLPQRGPLEGFQKAASDAVGDRYNQQFMDLSMRLTSAFEGLQSPIIHHLSPHGMARLVIANSSMSSNQSGESDILATLRDTRLPKLLSGELSAKPEFE